MRWLEWCGSLSLSSPKSSDSIIIEMTHYGDVGIIYVDRINMGYAWIKCVSQAH